MPAMTCSVKREENGGDRGAGRGKARRQKASHKWSQMPFLIDFTLSIQFLQAPRQILELRRAYGV